MRFFIEGSGGYTAVGGRKMMMEPGELQRLSLRRDVCSRRALAQAT